MNLSKSSYCKGIQCKKMLWLEDNCPFEKSEIDNTSVFDNGTEVGILAKDLFGKHIDIEFDNNLQNMIDKTIDLINNNKNIVITEASFNYNNNFCSVDILIKKDQEYEIYEVKSSTTVKDIYLDDISYQYYVLTKLGYNVSKASIVYINSFYERHGDLDLKKLFKISNVTKYVRDNLNNVENNIKEINDYRKRKEVNDDIGIWCIKPYDCPYFNYCTKKLPNNNIFKLRRMQNVLKFKYYEKGIYTYNDLLKEKIDDKVREQIEFELYNKEDKIEKENIKEFMKSLTYPLYFLDFETYQQSIPQFDMVKPYEQIPFQYSLHYIEKNGGELKHKEFLANIGADPRRKLAESLVNDIPNGASVLVYNMGFEKGRIKRLASLYPDLSKHLMCIHDNIIDLMKPFYNRDYYSKEMYGSYSIKYVLPALFPNDPSLNYHNLDSIHNGDEAMNAFKNLEKMSKEEQDKIRKCLLKYCELDTYAMVKIYEKLKKI